MTSYHSSPRLLHCFRRAKKSNQTSSVERGKPGSRHGKDAGHMMQTLMKSLIEQAQEFDGLTCVCESLVFAG